MPCHLHSSDLSWEVIPSNYSEYENFTLFLLLHSSGITSCLTLWMSPQMTFQASTPLIYLVPRGFLTYVDCVCE